MLLELTKPSARTMQAARACAFLLVFTLPPIVWLSGPGLTFMGLSAHANTLAWLPIAMLFGVLTIADYIVGRDVQNAVENETRVNDEQPYFKWLALLCLPVQLFTLWIATSYASTGMASGMLNWLGLVGWIMSIGAISGILAINVGHELIHKNTPLEQNTGGLILATVGYGTFKTEHVYGHHAWVATPRDHSSAQRGTTVYRFLFTAIFHNIRLGFKLEAERLTRRKLPVVSLQNECIWWTVATASIAAISFFAFGWIGLLFFVAQSLVAISELEAINYVEHYGLSREPIAGNVKGAPRYEKVTPMHSWNSGYFLTNAFLLQLQRHSDHHANASRRYQDLIHHESSPQLPGGYGAMILLSFFPPLWFAVIHPRIPKITQENNNGVVHPSH